MAGKSMLSCRFFTLALWKIPCHNGQEFLSTIFGDSNVKMHLGTRLALIAAGHLALHYEDGWIRSEQIAEEYNIPEFYLTKIMQQMVEANVLRSKRGFRGGFVLARPAKEISMLEIIEAAEGPIADRSELANMEGKDLFNSGLEDTVNRALDKGVSVFSKASLGQMVGK